MIRKTRKQAIAVCLILSMAVSIFSNGYVKNGTETSAAKKSSVSIKLNKKKLTLVKGEKATLKAKVSPAKAKVTWKSSKKKVATVSKKGKVTAIKKGSVNIIATAKYKGKSKKATCKVTVKNAPAQTDTAQPVVQTPTTQPTVAPVIHPTIAPTQAPAYENIAWIHMEEEEITMNIGESLSLNPTFDSLTATVKDCTYTSSKDYVASVSEDGKVTAAYLGVTYITIAAKIILT